MFNKNKKFDLVGHPECSHNWIHNTGKQYEWDLKSKFLDENSIPDSNNIVYMYICTMCGGEFWSTEKMFDIPHYRVKGVNNVK